MEQCPKSTQGAAVEKIKAAFICGRISRPGQRFSDARPQTLLATLKAGNHAIAVRRRLFTYFRCRLPTGWEQQPVISVSPSLQHLFAVCLPLAACLLFCPLLCPLLSI